MNVATVSPNHRRIRWIWVVFAAVGVGSIWQLSSYRFLGTEVDFNVVSGQVRTKQYVLWFPAKVTEESSQYARVMQQYAFKPSADAHQAWMFVRWRKSGAIGRTFINSHGGTMENLSRQIAATVEICRPARNEVLIALGEFQKRAIVVQRTAEPYSPSIQAAADYVQATTQNWLKEYEKGTKAQSQSGSQAEDVRS